MKQENYTLPNGDKSYILTASEKMVIVRKEDGVRMGASISLGYRYRDKDGNVLPSPIFEKPEDYTEDNMTEEELEMCRVFNESNLSV